MCVRPVVILALTVLVVGCGGQVFKQYEYEEDLTLTLDGSATVVVNASTASLVAFHGLALDPGPRARLDREGLRRLYSSPGVRVSRVSRPWRRHGRQFVQIRVEVDDVRTLGSVAPFAWSTYELVRSNGEVRYHQVVGRATDQLRVSVGWSGDELVGFKLHLPSRVEYHNSRLGLERGNILTWEQSLGDRRAGLPLDMEVRMQDQSILYRTLAVFVGAFLAAVAFVAVLIWWVVFRARNRVDSPPSRPPGP